MNRLFVCAFLLAMLAPAAAQNARPVEPENGPRLLENEQIKVRELRLKAGVKLGSQTLPNTFLYGLTDGALVFTQPGLPSQQAAIANDSGKDIRALLVEIKQRPAATPRPKGKAKGSKAPKGGSSKPAARKK
jgi:hypothetical protein